MIGKISKGSSAHAIANYLHGPGKRNEHVRANGMPGGEVIGGNIGRRGMIHGDTWARTMTRIASRRKDISRPFYAVSLRNPASDRTLSDAEWSVVVAQWAHHMGLDGKPYVVVRHADDHVHAVFCRVGFDRKIWSIPTGDRYRSMEAIRNIERDHDLTPVRTPERGTYTDRETGRTMTSRYTVKTTIALERRTIAETEIERRHRADPARHPKGSWKQRIRDIIDRVMSSRDRWGEWVHRTISDAFDAFHEQGLDLIEKTTDHTTWHVWRYREPDGLVHDIAPDELGASYQPERITDELAKRHREHQQRTSPHEGAPQHPETLHELQRDGGTLDGPVQGGLPESDAHPARDGDQGRPGSEREILDGLERTSAAVAEGIRRAVGDLDEPIEPEPECFDLTTEPEHQTAPRIRRSHAR